MIEPADLTRLYQDHVASLTSRYSAALSAAGYDLLVLHSGTAKEQCQFDDQHWPLRPTPMFRHWLPLAEPDALLVFEPGATPWLHRTLVTDFWEGQPAPESDHFWDSFAVTEVTDVDALAGTVPTWSRAAFIGDPARAAQWGVADAAVNPAGLLTALEVIRAHKTEYERRCIAIANARAARGHQSLLDTFAGGGAHSELGLHLQYLAATAQDDSETPYKDIVALDRHAGILHHVNYDREPPAGDDHALLVDAGATCLGYIADITRTVARGSGSAATAFAALVDRMEGLQQELCRRVEPGLAYESLHDQSHQLLADVLRDLEIASASADELVSSGATRRFLPHGLGHSIGIQTHDVGCRPTPPRPDNAFLRTTVDIEPGHVLTIEPGCYFIPQLLDQLRQEPIAASFDWSLVDALAGFGGVRIEDNLAITADGVQNLTRDNWPTQPE